MKNIEIENIDNVQQSNITKDQEIILPITEIPQPEFDKAQSSIIKNQFVHFKRMAYYKSDPDINLVCNQSNTGYEMAGLNSLIEVDGLVWCEEVKLDGVMGGMYINHIYYLQQNQKISGNASIQYRLSNCDNYDKEISDVCKLEIANFIDQKIPIKNLEEFQVDLIKDGYIKKN